MLLPKHNCYKSNVINWFELEKEFNGELIRIQSSVRYLLLCNKLPPILQPTTANISSPFLWLRNLDVAQLGARGLSLVCSQTVAWGWRVHC